MESPLPDAIPNVSDVDSCMNYLKEASLYKMMNDPNHRAMLFLLEVLMNSETSMSIEDLGEKLFSENVSRDIQEVCGCNSDGLKSFVERYPSLFQIDGNHISPIDVTDCTTNIDIENGNICNTDSSDLYRLRKPVDLTQETEAVKYFQSQLAKREEHWVSIKSLAGHLSQASESIRKVVGPQAYFRKFIERHPHVFETQGDLISLRDNFSSICLSKGTKNRPRSAVINSRRVIKRGRPTSMIINQIEKERELKFTPTPSKSLLAIDSREFQAAMFLRTVIRRKTCAKISINHLFLYLAQAPSSVRNCIGWTKIELEEFVRKQSTLFEIDRKGHISCLDTEEISIVVNDNLSCKDGVRTIINQRGTVYHVTKLWGIVDLGQHEHVFFDKSIFKHLDDLQRHFQVGECIYFNAILAPKQSRAKWRATQVWKESDKDLVQKFCGDLICAPKKSFNTGPMVDNDSVSCCRSVLSEQRHIIDNYHDIDEELAEILQLSKMDSDDEYNNWDVQSNRDDLADFSVTTVPSPTESSTECLSNSSGIPYENNSQHDTSGGSGSARISNRSQQSVETTTVATQTISTGDIMAAHVYIETLDTQT